MNPFIIARHGLRKTLSQELNEFGIQQSKDLAYCIKEILANNQDITIYYGEDQTKYSVPNRKTAEIIGKQLGINPFPETKLASQPSFDTTPAEDLEFLARLYEKADTNGNLLICIANDNIVCDTGRYFNERYNFRKLFSFPTIDPGNGLYFDFDKKDILYIPEKIIIEKILHNRIQFQ